MRSVVFAYHDMGLAGLRALRRAGIEIAAIFSHEDDPDENCWFGSVKEWAIQAAIPLYRPLNVNEPEWVATIAALRPDVIFSFYYRHMLKDQILALPERGAYNLHGSLLPAYRGRCPVNWVLVRGERQTGVTLHHMVAKADAGDIVGQQAIPIARTDTAVILYKKLCDAAGGLLDRLLPQMKSGTAPRLPQDIEKGSYFGGRRPEDGRIDWRWPAERVYDMIRAVTEPYPGAFCLLPDGMKLILWWGTPEEVNAPHPPFGPGRVEVEGNRVLVWTGQGRVHLADVETIDGRMTGEGLIRYFNDREGLVLS
jgi:methionyl-tRNA formyltransferase